MFYSFDSEIAKEYGVNEAIIIQNFIFWITKNKANQKHCYEVEIEGKKVNRTFTYNSIEAFTVLFPFWTTNQIRHILDKLIANKILVSGCFNKNKYDRTKWYAFMQEDKWICENSQMKMGKIPNQVVKNPEPIPDIKPDSNTDTITDIDSKLKLKKKDARPKNIQEVKDCFIKLGLSENDAIKQAQEFLNHFEMVGWKYGKGQHPIIDWKRACITWKTNYDKFPRKKTIDEQDRANGYGGFSE
jgi:hypothetical protein